MKDMKLKQLSPAERLLLEKVEGMVFDMQRYSSHDGPGLRTNVFLKGWPLHCQWCAKPKPQNLQPELAQFENYYLRQDSFVRQME